MRRGSTGVRTSAFGRPTAMPEVVMVPGLGAPGYLLPWARALGRSTRVVVLDVPGWRWGRARAGRPTLDGIAETVEQWLRAAGSRGVVLLGHSTGAQSVARVARRSPELLAGAVLAGPTFAPAARSLPGLARRTVVTALRERVGEIPAVLPSYLHSGVLPLVRLVIEGRRDAVEDVVTELRLPVLVLTGRGDELAPPAWAGELARRAGPAARVRVMPGAHNFCFPFPDAAAGAVLAWAARLP